MISSYSPSFLSFGDDNTCVAGCCDDDGVCSCRDGYAGAKCDQELRCAVAVNVSSGFATGDCTTSESGSSVKCSCGRLGSVAVLRFRLTPSVRFSSEASFAAAASRWPVTTAVILLMLTLGLSTANAADSRTFYSINVPRWAAPVHKWGIFDLLRFTLLTRTTVLRVFFVVPDHTLFTRMQQVPFRAVMDEDVCAQSMRRCGTLLPNARRAPLS